MNNIPRYRLTDKTTNPDFEYLVKDLMSMDYMLFNTFDKALKAAITLSNTKSHHSLIYEKYFNTKTREFHGMNTFEVIHGEVRYDKYARPELHLEFYVNAGEWLNPGEIE